jgi:hypothetical protein
MARHIPTSDPQTATERVLAGFGLLAFVVLVFTIAAYAVTFAPQAGFKLSSNTEDWSRFAEYLGGTLGPLYGLFAFLGVLMTVVLQRRQIDDVRAQSEQQALQQLLATLSGKIEDMLRAAPATKPAKIFDFMTARRDIVSLRSFLSVGGSLVLLSDAQEPAADGHQSWIPEIKECVIPEVGALTRELDELVQCLKEYRAAGGSGSIQRFYLDRYVKVIGYIAALQFPVSDDVMNEFDLGYAKALVLGEARKHLVS